MSEINRHLDQDINMRYIYFETFKIYHGPPSGGVKDHKLQNVNILKYKPSGLNSDGLWCRRNATKHHDTTTYVDQYWVDLDTFRKSIMDVEPRRTHWKYEVARVNEAIKKIQLLEEHENNRA
jgi:hypothetical protein